MRLNPDLLHDLQRAGLDTRTDAATQTLYSTDASIYKIRPLGVAFPRTLDQLQAAVELAARYRVPLLARGAGSSLAGQAIGEALILDCSRYLNQIHEIHKNMEGQGGWVVAEPGVVLTHLNQAAASLGLMLGPDPASADRATLGGSLANNASGSHSIVYGMFADHIIAADVYIGDGSLAQFIEIPVAEAKKLAGLHSSTLSGFYQAALGIRATLADEIRARWPRTYRRAAGYNLNYLLPWSPSAPPQFQTHRPDFGAYPPVRRDHINLAHLLAGSEGTLGIIRTARLKLVPKPRHTVLAVLAYNSVAEACDAAPRLLRSRPSAIELIPRILLKLAAGVPAYARLLDFIPPGGASPTNGGALPAALQVIEFAGENLDHLIQQARGLRADVLVAEAPAAQQRIWAVRKAGLGILQSQPGDRRTQTFIEDLSVPVENLGRFVRQMDQIAAAHNTEFYYYAHASAGCLHMRPILNLKTPQGVAELRQIAQEAIAATIALGGTTTGEHGDGLARSEWLKMLYGPRIVGAFRRLKRAADPYGILNPGKIVDPLPMDTNLRYGSGYQTQGWETVLQFDKQDQLSGAIEICNGAGVCRKDNGVMCPSFQATREEMHSTRGRANLLRAFIRHPSPLDSIDVQDVFAALDACLACKGCKAECPSLVDMAKLKYEFMHHYYQSRRRRLRDYLFGYIGRLAQLAHGFGGAFNALTSFVPLHRLITSTLGLTPLRPIPQFHPKPPARKPVFLSPSSTQTAEVQPDILYLPDAFTRYFTPADESAALQVLRHLGFRVRRLPVLGAGRTLISKGFLAAGQRQAHKVIRAIDKLDPAGKLPIVGLEPSEIYTLRDEYLDFFPGDQRVEGIARRAWMIDEFLVRQPACQAQLSSVHRPLSPVLLHGHCYQKAQPPADDGMPVGVEATTTLLTAIGCAVSVVEAGCCGMAGAFGYEAEHYELSMQVGELVLLPRVRDAGEGVIVAACGTSCQAQIEDGAARQAVHPIRLVREALAARLARHTSDGSA